MSGIRDVYEQARKLYNDGDLEGLADCYTEDAVLVSPDGTARGRAAICEYWGRDQAAFPERVLTAEVILDQGDTLATEFTWVATNAGPIVLPDGTELPPTGKQAQTRGMELVQVRDGKAAAHRLYWDNMAVARQLGLLP